MGILSTTGHVKPCGKLGGPSSKAKYHLMTDSELVPRGKGEKNPGEGSEIEPETVRLQAVRAPQGVMAGLLINEPVRFWLLRG